MPVMKTQLIAVLVSVLAGLAAAQADTAPTGKPAASGFSVKRGVNLSHWLSQCFGWSPRASFVTEKDLQLIASLGYDHVRIPIDEKEMWTEDGRPSQEAFAYLQRALEWSAKHGLRAVVDLHTVRAHYFNAEHEGGRNTLFTDAKAQETFVRLWQELSARLSSHSTRMVAYEIMNEPVADDPADWNRLLAKTVAAVRAREPGRVLVLGSNRWQAPETFPQLEVPAGDPNIILSVHTYAPMAFTHHTAYWVPIKTYTGPVRYPGRPIADADWERYADRNVPAVAGLMKDARLHWDKKRLQGVFEPALKRARSLGLPLYCGEFGVYPTVPRQDRLSYYRDIVAVFEENGMAWANWDYKGDFGIVGFDRENKTDGAPDTELIQALLGTTQPPSGPQR